MKKILISAALMIIAAAAYAQSGKSIYNKYSEAKQVSAVYISPAMFKLMGKLPEMEVGEDKVNLTPVIKSLEGMYIIDSENISINENLRKDVEKFVNSGRYEMVMEVKEDQETVRMYTVGKEIITSFVLLSNQSDECTFICIDGKIPREQLEELMAKASD